MTVRVEKFSHHFTVSGFNFTEENIIRGYCKQLVKISSTTNYNGEVIITDKRVFADRVLSPRHYRFHIEMLREFLATLNHHYVSYEVVKSEIYKPVEVDFKLNPEFKPRDYQEPIVNAMAEADYKYILTLQTGMGKTAVFLFAVTKRSVRTALVIQPKYFSRWLPKINSAEAKKANRKQMLYLDKPGDIYTVQGSAQLASVIMLAKCGELNAKFIIISSTTYAQYIKYYKANGLDDKYHNVAPCELWELLGVGMLGVDEGHENFHANFLMELHTNVPLLVTLSATLTPDDPFLKRMYGVLYPPRLRDSGQAYVKYIEMLHVPYNFDKDKKYPKITNWGRRTYSQLAYENFLQSKGAKDRLQSVFDMINHDIKTLFMVQRYEDYKLLLFFDTIDMCAHFEKALSEEYPELKVSKYTAEEDFNETVKNDIIISTFKSGSTGIDIPKLQMCFSFTMRSSTQANLQMIGRLRMLKDAEGVNPLYLVYWCRDIPQHVSYHRHQVDLFTPRTLSLQERNTLFVI